MSAKISFPIRVGLVGTGYAAKLRAEAILSDPRATLIAVSGHNYSKTVEFAEKYQCLPLSDWQDLVSRTDIDLVIIANINSLHGAIAHISLQNNKHVVVEYPLSLDITEAENLINLAQSKSKLLHIEHIEILGSLHQSLRSHLPKIGTPFYARYSTITPQNPAPEKWTYHPELFGFPLMGALSRVQRFTDLFGEVNSLHCVNKYWGKSQFFNTCICQAQLQFKSGLSAEIIYGKGESLWCPSRLFEVHGDQGALIFDGDKGKLIQSDQITEIELSPRKGLFLQDTQNVLDHLLENKPLYIKPEASLYALKVADQLSVSSVGD